MKTTIDIPDSALQEAMRHSKARTKRDAVVTAVEYYNRRQRMAALARHLGTCPQLMTPEELRRSRKSE
jgi:Arc/MetJ family transcription regulator